MQQWVTRWNNHNVSIYDYAIEFGYNAFLYSDAIKSDYETSLDDDIWVSP